MDRRSPLVAAVAAVAILGLASPDARAQAESAPADSTATVTIEPAPVTAATESQQPSLQDTAPTGAANAETLVAVPAVPSGPPTTELTGAAPPSATAPPPAPPPEGLVSVRPAPADRTTVTPPPSLPVVTHPAPVDPSREAPTPGDGAPAAADRPTGGGLEQILPAVESDLRQLQADVDAIRRQLNNGATPPVGSLNRLRSKLEQLAPVLLALDVRVDAAGSPSADARQLLHRVRVRLAATQASAAGLVAALRKSGLHGPELDALMRELERFRALAPALDLGPGSAPFAPTPHPIESAAPATSVPSNTSGASPSRPAVAPPRAQDGPEPAGHRTPEPWPSAPGSSTASPGAALSVAGLASLAALLIALFLPRLRARLELAPGRGHAVASVLVLERPG